MEPQEVQSIIRSQKGGSGMKTWVPSIHINIGRLWTVTTPLLGCAISAAPAKSIFTSNCQWPSWSRLPDGQQETCRKCLPAYSTDIISDAEIKENHGSPFILMGDQSHWDRFAAVLLFIESLNHSSGQSFSAQPVLGSTSYHCRSAMCHPPLCWGRSGMQTPASGMDLAAFVNLGLLSNGTSAGAWSGDEKFSWIGDVSELVSGVRIGETETGNAIESPGMFKFVGGIFSVDMRAEVNMQNSLTVTGCIRTWSSMKLCLGSFCIGQRALP